jgi:hypothetical protein
MSAGPRNDINTIDFDPDAKSIHAGDLNTMRDICAAAADGGHRTDVPLAAERWLGIIDATDQTDYTDARYWVKRAHASNTGAVTETIAAVSYGSTHAWYQQTTATNLAEVVAGTHTLVKDTLVEVMAFYDWQSPPVKHLVFSTAGSASFWARITDSTSVGSNQWSYSFEEIEKDTAGYGGWTAVSGGRTGTNTAYNTDEELNSATQLRGVVDLVVTDSLGTTTITIHAIPNNQPVWVTPVTLTDGSTEYEFYAPNDTTDAVSCAS